MQNTSTPNRRRRIAGLTAAAVLAVFGVAAIGQGLNGQSTVRDALALEGVTGAPHMTPARIADNANKAGLKGIALPTCSVAGTPIDDGASARCFAEYMRVDALVATGGKTYAQLPPFASKDGKGTYDMAAAVKMPDGSPMNNPMGQLWVTETALTTALNTSYMAERISLLRDRRGRRVPARRPRIRRGGAVRGADRAAVARDRAPAPGLSRDRLTRRPSQRSS